MTLSLVEELAFSKLITPVNRYKKLLLMEKLFGNLDSFSGV